MAIYIKYVQCGVNYNNKKALHLATVYKDMPKQSTHSLSFKTLLCQSVSWTLTKQHDSILVNNLLKEDSIARQCSPLNNSIFAKLQGVSDASCDEDLVQNLLFNVVALSRYIGPCLSNYTQITQENVDMHTYPPGTTVMKAFVANDFTFYN
jgi:hypothetical protein